MFDTIFPTFIYYHDNLITQFEEKVEGYKQFINKIASVWGTSRTEDSPPSLHRTNPNLHKYKEFEELCEAILQHANLASVKAGYKFKKLRIVNMWANVSQEGDVLFPHVHPGTLFSGAFYLCSPPNCILTIKRNDSFFIEPNIINDVSATEKYYECLPNRLILFRSDTWHCVKKQGPGEKIVVSFNILPE